MTINPADCDLTTVYTGECRNFPDTAWVRFDSGRRRSPDARDGNTWLIDVAHGSFWMADDKVRNLVPLVPAPTGGQWTRDDLPSEGALADLIRDALDGGIYEGKMLLPGHRLRAIIDLLARWMNAHHPKPECRCDELRALIAGQKEHVTKTQRERDEEKSRAEFFAKRADEARRERDAAVARAEKAEKRHTWPKTTPTGHTYVEPRTYEALRHEHDNAAQASVECWEADECPPEPTWEMVGSAHREVEHLQCDRDEWKERALLAEDQPAVCHPEITRADVEKAMRSATPGLEANPTQVTAVHALVSGDDPVVFVVRESGIAAVEAKRVEDQWHADGSLMAWMGESAEEVRGQNANALRNLAYREAVARAIEAEQAVSPVEEKARELAKAGGVDFDEQEPEGVEMLIGMARHVLGQEVSSNA